MRIATWNVNSVRARMERLVPWLVEKRPDIVCLQETKCVDDKFPREPIEELGYEIATFGQRTYNGVAILSRSGLEDVRCGFPGDGDEARAIAATVGDVMVLNLYVVNGQSVGAARYADKLAWLDSLARYVEDHFPMDEKVVLCGDFNVTFDDRDVYDPDKWREHILCSTPEREALAGVMSVGLSDALRKFSGEPGVYTWWDFRTFGFKKGQGLRIDHFLVSPPALAACSGVEVDLEARGGKKPSDHAPVIATFG
ncbi:MAG: exodeoxyribonuclease III [Planctomycetota bacterium]